MNEQKLQTGAIGILVGGGPAPGINGVIAAAALRCLAAGRQVLGIRDGFKRLIAGDTGHVAPLTAAEVSRLHVQGGSYLRTARANPTKNPQHLENVVATLRKLNVSGLITIGGDDTCFSALKLEQAARGRLHVVHVPKTIDNDLDLPEGVPTFGFETARHVGTQIVKTIMVEARTTSHWFFVVAMGRQAGHLALGIGKAAGTTLTLIPEEFSERPLRLSRLVDVLAGAILKRLSMGHEDGVAVLAEGLAEALDPEELSQDAAVPRDDHGHIQLSEVNLAGLLKRAVLARLAPLGMTPVFREKDIGFELRCADPIGFDLEYTRDLGYSAASFLLDGGNAAIAAMVHGRFTPIPFDKILDARTGRTRVRPVDIHSTGYEIARRYMIRLEPEDFEQPETLAKYATLARMTPEKFRSGFEYVVEDERRRRSARR
ncbi:MAG: diphosphate--fructose-6-phosphate 1-phosphotransferase [Nitrospiraceae bacterium]